MKRTKWISMLLTAVMLLGLAVPAFADGEDSDAFPAVTEEFPPASDGTVFPEDAPVGDGTAEDAAMGVPAQPPVPSEGVTLKLTGAADGIEKVTYYAPDGTCHQARQDGLYDLADPDADPVLTETADGISTQLTVAPDEEFTVALAAGYDVQTENGTVTSGDALSGLDILAPAEGTVTVTVTAVAEPEQETEPETVPEPETVTESETQTISAAGVTVDLAGTVEAIHQIIYQGPDDLIYFTESEGTFYNRLDGAGNNEAVYVAQTDSIQTQLTALPNGAVRQILDGADARLYLEATSDVTVEGATVLVNELFESGRLVDIQLPVSGTVTISVAAYDGDVPTVIPFTFYNEGWDNGVIVGGGSVISGPALESYEAYVDGDNVLTGGVFEVWTGPGYEIEVLEGGSILETRAPTGAAAANVPAGSTCFVLKVDLGAEQFVIAAVKEGEHYSPATGTFKDVPDDSWYKDIIEKAYAAGIVTGITEDTFSPNATASRGQTVAMLWRQAGSPSGSGGGSFTDLTADYYKDAVAWASYVRAVNGTSSTSFEPGSCITREQLAAVLYRVAGSPGAYSGGLLGNYSDGGSVSSYARTAMQWALDYGIVTGYADGMLRPQAAASRAEVCAMLMRYSELVGRYPTEPPTPQFEEQAVSQNVSHTERNLSNPKLIRPKRDKIDDGLYSNGDRDDPWMQQWAETYWDLDRSGEDLMWSLRNLTRMYSGPGESYEVVYTLHATYEVSRLGPDENGWTPVVYHEYVTGEGFTGWDHTGYVRTDKISSIRPCHTHVADFSSGPALWDWCESGVPEGDMYYDTGATANGTFYHEAYTPSISGDTYTYTLRGGGKVTIRNVIPEGLISVEASGEEELDNALLFVYIEKGYGIKAAKGYSGGYGLSCSGDNMSCEICWEVDMSTDENIELTMFSGDGAPRVLQATIKDPLGGSRMGDGASRFMFLNDDGNLYSEYGESFFNLKSGYKLKSLSPYASAGKVENNELHHFTVQNVPEGVDQIWFEVVRG